MCGTFPSHKYEKMDNVVLNYLWTTWFWLEIPNPVRVKSAVRYRWRRSLTIQFFLIRFNPVRIFPTRDIKERLGIGTILFPQEKLGAFPWRSLIFKIYNTIHTHVKNLPLDEFSAFWTNLREVIERQWKVSEGWELADGLRYGTVELVSSQIELFHFF